jgi:hypothetical protein
MERFDVVLLRGFLRHAVQLLKRLPVVRKKDYRYCAWKNAVTRIEDPLAILGLGLKTDRCAIWGTDRYIRFMPSKPIELPPDVARRFFKDLRAFLAEKNTIKADGIAVRQLQVMRRYQGPHERKLRLSDVKQMFLHLKDQAWRHGWRSISHVMAVIVPFETSPSNSMFFARSIDVCQILHEKACRQVYPFVASGGLASPLLSR